MRRLFACILATTIAATSLQATTRVVFAQGMDADTKEAKALFDEGVKLYKAGKYEEARVKFKAAYGLKKRPSIVLNLANAELQTKRPMDAAGHFREVIAMADAKPEDKDEAKNGIAEARKQLAVVMIDAPANTAVSVDGESRGTGPFTDGIELMPGAHTVVLKVGTKETIEKLNLAAGTTVTVKAGGAEPPPVVPPPVTPPPTTPPPTTPPPTTPPPETPPPATPPPSTPPPGNKDVSPQPNFFKSLHPVTYVTAGVAVVSGVLWGVFYATSQTHYSNAETLAEAVQCPRPTGATCFSPARREQYRVQGRDEIDQGDSARTLSVVFAVTTIAAVGATVATIVLLRKKENTVAIGASPTFGGANLSLVGSF